MSGKRAFLELLKQEGVEILFGNPGTTELPLMDALAVENELRYVLGLQEATVIGMSPPDSTIRTSTPPSRSCGPTCRRSRGRW